MTRAKAENALFVWDSGSSTVPGSTPWGATITYKFLTSLPSGYVSLSNGNNLANGQPYTFSAADFDD